MNLFFKLIFQIKSLPVVVVLAQRDSRIINLISALIKREMKSIIVSPRESFPVFGKKVLLVDISNEKSTYSDIIFLLRRSLCPVLIINGRKPNNDIFKRFPERGLAVADAETARLLRSDGIAVESVGFDERSDLWASDLNIADEANFKINHGGDSVPFWMARKLEKEEITEILLAVRVGMALGLNLVQISQNLKND